MSRWTGTSLSQSQHCLLILVATNVETRAYDTLTTAKIIDKREHFLLHK
jgi:hypothetical protein